MKWGSSLPAVLVPGLNLCVCQTQRGSELHPVLHTQVLLALEAPLQLRELVVGEGRARFPGLLHARRGHVATTRDVPVCFIPP